MSIAVVDVAVVLSLSLFEKELLPKETFFCNYEKNDTVCATHNAPLCHVCPIITRQRKRRS